MSSKNSIQFETLTRKWKIVFPSKLGSNKAGIIGPKGVDDWPHNILDWKYSDGINWIAAGRDIIISESG